MTITKLLIANRGEIAIRVARTAAAMGIATVGVCAEDDTTSLHVRRVDEVARLRGVGTRAYLDIGRLVEIAQGHRCDAVHPGYGFLSESSSFAAACSRAGMTFIGSSPALLDLLGDKAAARRAAQEAGACPVPGIDRPCTLDDVRRFHAGLGPGAAVMIKALAGGGGRGMRRVEDAAELEGAYRACREEASLSFGSPEVYAEQLVPRARHIEVQILGDVTGVVVHAWERECTLQRRNQKLVEIAPSPSLDDEQRRLVLDASVDLASAVGYQGVGTFEYLVDADDPSLFYFMEINPRIQVEHTVTEELTGLDLVRLQIELARGVTLAELGLAEPPPRRGCAIQARINLESMDGEGTPQAASGTIVAYDPPGGPGIRVDDYLYVGYRVNPSYDTLGAKIVARSTDTRAALALLRRSLLELRLEGVANNRGLLVNLVDRPEVIANEVTTGFIESVAAELVEVPARRQLHFDAAQPSDNGSTASLPVAKGQVGVGAPTAGSLVALEVGVGDELVAGQVVGRIEAMKMEFEMVTPVSGTVSEVACVAPGRLVDQDEVLVVVSPGEISRTVDASDGPMDLDAVRADLAEVIARREAVLDAARPAAVQQRHGTGQRTARENVDDLVDEGSFNEYGAFALAAQRARHSDEELVERSPADGLVLGTATVNAELVGADAARCALMAYDYTVMAGSQGFMNHKKTDRLLDVIDRLELPVVLFAEGAGGRPSDTDYPAVAALDLHTFSRFAGLSGMVPTIGVATGNCFAGNAALYGLCDVTVATVVASIGMAGPAMVEGGGLGSHRAEDIGPVSVQAPNGVVDIVVDDEAAAVATVKQCLSYFQGPLVDWEADDQRRLRHLVPENPRKAYDIRQLIGTLVDQDSLLELRRDFATSAFTAFARLEGTPVGLIANDPMFLGGAIDADAGDKFARFIRLCNARRLPLIALCDTPGFMVGPESERRATVRHVARMFVAAANIEIPVVTVVVRKAYGLGAMAMAGGGFSSPVLSVSWPSGTFGSMGVEGAVQIAARRDLDRIVDADIRAARFAELVDRAYDRGRAVNVASHVEIDAVIDPAETREWIVRALHAAAGVGPPSLRLRRWVDTW